MPVIDLRGKRAERQAQILMMMQQFRNRSAGLGGGESELERVEKEIEDRRKQREEESRLRGVAESQMGANRALEESRRKESDIKGWQAGQKNILDWEKSQREERELTEGTLPLRRAQTEESQAGTQFKKAQTLESRARTGKTLAETEGKLDENQRKSMEWQIDRARRQRNMAHLTVTEGGVVDKTGADALEGAERILTGNPGYTLPRNPDGSWKAPPKQELGMVDEKGMPTAKYAETIDKIQEPNSGFGKLMGDAAEAKANGAPPWVMDQFKARWTKESAMTLNELKGSMVQPFLDAGDYEGANKALAAFRNPPKPQMPSKEERQEFARQGRLVNELQSIEKRYWDLKNSGRIPVGRLKQPMLDAWAAVGNDDPELQSLRKDIEMVKGEYLLYLSGRAASDNERAEIKQRIPTLFDSQQTFETSLPRFQEKVKTNISIDAGLLYSLGYQIPDNIPVLPMDEILKSGPVPNVITETGFIPAEYMKQHIKGIGVLGRDPRNVAGLNEWRDKGGPPVAQPGGPTSSETEEPPMSTESNATISDMPSDPMAYKDPVRARGLLREREKVMQKLSEGQQ